MPDIDEFNSAPQRPIQLDSSHGRGQQRPREEDVPPQRAQRRRQGAVASDNAAGLPPPHMQSVLQQYRNEMQQKNDQDRQTQLDHNAPYRHEDQRGAQTVVSNARHSSATMQFLHTGAQPPQSRPNQGPLPMPTADDADDGNGSGGDQPVPGSAPVPDGPSGKRIGACIICHDFMYPFGSKRLRYY